MLRSVALPLLASLFLAGASPQTTKEGGWNTSPTEAYPRKRDDVIFLDRTVGFYGTGRGDLYRTDDGGAHWRADSHFPGVFIRALAFVSADVGFIGNLGLGLAGVTDPTPLFRTRDGGRSWQPVDLDGAPVAGICAIDVLRSETIVEGEVRERVLVHAAGRANGPAQLLRSEDGGETWRFIDLSDRVGMILDVKFTDPSTGYVFAGSSADLAQSSAVILRTRDGGRSWREVYRSGRKHEILWKASFTEGVAYATLQNNDPANVQQRVVKSTDDGETWFELPLVADASVREYGIGFVDSAHGWVGTSAGGFETRDGGLSWTPAALAPDANRIRVHAVDGSPMVYAIGREVQVYRTRPEGAGSN